MDIMNNLRLIMDYNFDICLAKLSIITSEVYWEKLVNNHSQRSILFHVTNTSHVLVTMIFYFIFKK